MITTTPARALHGPLLDWYPAHASDLPWRSRERTPWGVLVSEVMLQQTPVQRVLPVWQEWLQRWPTPAALAAEAPGEAVRAWGRLGYPRRALRLHAAAVLLRDRHGGEVPRDPVALRDLPGVGEYTCAAVLAFAFGDRSTVVDTNVRRVLVRAVSGRALPAPALTAAETALAAAVMPAADNDCARWNAAVMELGALVCTARSPVCGRCPLEPLCAWRQAGQPPHPGPPRRGQSWAGTDRQCRGTLVQVLRDSTEPVASERLARAWPAAEQRERCLHGLVADGLAESLSGGRYCLPR